MEFNLKNFPDSRKFEGDEEKDFDSAGYFLAISEWFEGSKKELREIANLEEFDAKRFEKGATTLSRLRLLARADFAQEVLGE